MSPSPRVRDSVADVADVASDAGDTGSGVVQGIASTSTRTEWVPVTDKYVSPADIFVSDIAIFVLKRDIKLQRTN